MREGLGCVEDLVQVEEVGLFPFYAVGCGRHLGFEERHGFVEVVFFVGEDVQFRWLCMF